MRTTKEKDKLPAVNKKAWNNIGEGYKTNVFGRMAPQEIDMEQFVLGAMTMDARLVSKIKAQLTPEMFYLDSHELIASVIYELHDASEHADLIKITKRLRDMNKLDEIGGPMTIVHLTNRVANPDHAMDYIPYLRDLWWRRMLIAQSAGLTEAAYGSETMTDISRKINNLNTATVEMINGNKPVNYHEKFDAAVFRSEEVRAGKIAPYITTSFTGFDRLLGGYSGGDMICVAGRASMGKTAFIASSMIKYAKLGINTGLVSLEMGSNDIIYRLLSIKTGIPFRRIKEGNYDDQQRAMIIEAMSAIRANIFINDTAPMHTERFRGVAQEMVLKYGVKILFVDYMQLMESSKQSNQREQEVSHVSRTMKMTAKELDVPVIALSQLSRQVENRKGGENIPILSDLRESGSIEQDSDKVIFLYRPDYYNQVKDEVGNDLTGKVKLIVAKNRNGALGTGIMDYVAPLMQFKEQNEEIEF